VSIRRVFVRQKDETTHHTIETAYPDSEGRKYVWYACTVKGGREQRDFDVKQLVQAVEAMGAGEILLNAIDRDGSNRGFDLELIRDVKASVKIPVIASSGAGHPEHFVEVFKETNTDAALGAGMVSLLRLPPPPLLMSMEMSMLTRFRASSSTGESTQWLRSRCISRRKDCW
jgi:imidazole glycerol-phosphate synthase